MTLLIRDWNFLPHNTARSKKFFKYMEIKFIDKILIISHKSAERVSKSYD